MASLISTIDGSLTISGSVHDDLDFPGVYRVDLDVPKAQEGGNYEMNVALNGL